MLSLLNNLVDISKVHSGDVKLNKSSVNLNEIIGELHQEYRSNTEQKNIDFLSNINPDDPEKVINTDSRYLIEIFKNLLNNAFKYTPYGSIRFGYYQKEGRLIFFVSDTGNGIPFNMQDKIFEPFRQVNMNISRKYEGAGLGLSLARAYVLALGGNIWVQSSPENGSTFYFTIHES